MAKNFEKIFSSIPSHLVELGSGDGNKTAVLIKQLLEDGVKVRYTPIDISEGAINNLTNTLKKKFSSLSLNITGWVGDYFDGLASITNNEKARKMVLFLGVTLYSRWVQFISNCHNNFFFTLD